MMPRPQPLHIAGIGASAGGLEAMLPMFARLRATGRIAYVVAQHMAKDGHDALVTRLIARESTLPVALAAEGVRLQPDTIYVIPSGRNGTVEGRALHLSEPGDQYVSTPSANALFESIAREAGAQGIGIVLSGTGSDGTAGCRAIKAAGGLTLAQDPLEAKFDGMPSAAAEARLIDHVLEVGRMGDLLATLFPGTPAVAAHAPGAPVSVLATPAANEVPPDDPELAQLLRQVHKATGIDFSSYKEETLLRRLEKRKATLGVASASEYQALIRRDPGELATLQHLFLVSVSSFFRDADSFSALTQALAARLAAKAPDEPIRVWVPGCASGEEPYTLAIILHELLRQSQRRQPIDILGTDLNPEALAMARAACYRQTAFKEMAPELLGRYFAAHGQHHALLSEVKTCVRFEQCDVLAGPSPLSLDLVSCRNLLIYMKSGLQDQLIKRFHQGLHAQGLLFIGQSESLSFVGNSLFAPIDQYHRLYRRRH